MLNIGYERLEELVRAERREWPFETKTWSVAYGVDLSETWQLNLSYSDGHESKTFDLPVAMELNNQLYGIDLTLLVSEDAFIDFGFLFSESVLEANRTDRDFTYEDTFDSWDFSIRGGSVFYFGDWSVLPTIGIGYQSAEQKLKLTETGLADIGDLLIPFLADAEDATKSDVFYLSTGLSVDYPLWYDEAFALYASAGLDWIEPLSDDTVNNYRQSISTRRRTSTIDESRGASDGEGSGTTYLSISLLVDDFILGTTWLESIDVPDVGRSLSFDLGISF